MKDVVSAADQIAQSQTASVQEICDCLLIPRSSFYEQRSQKATSHDEYTSQLTPKVMDIFWKHRRRYVCPAPADLLDLERWPQLRAIGMTINSVIRDHQNTWEVRFYILSKKLSARRFAEAVRGHWGIENSLHWQLDVTFGEDQSRIRKGHADANFSALRRTALSLLKNNRTKKVGIKNKRILAACDDAYMLEVLMGT